MTAIADNILRYQRGGRYWITLDAFAWLASGRTIDQGVLDALHRLEAAHGIAMRPASVCVSHGTNSDDQYITVIAEPSTISGGL